MSLNLEEYPFEYIDTKQELRNMYDKLYNEMQLFACGEKPDIAQLIKFCEAKRRTIINGYWHVITFFDFHDNAGFTNLPITAMHSAAENFSRHIKALYTYNTVNSYSKLVIYSPDQWTGIPNEIQIA